MNGQRAKPEATGSSMRSRTPRLSGWGGWTKRCHSCYRVLLYPSRQRGAVINKLCDSSYRHHPLWHTQTQRAHARTHMAAIIVFPEAMSLLGGHVFKCNILPVFLYFFLLSSLPSTCVMRSSRLPFHVHSAFLTCIPSSVSMCAHSHPDLAWLIRSTGKIPRGSQSWHWVEIHDGCCHVMMSLHFDSSQWRHLA